MDDVWFQYLDWHDENRILWKKINRLLEETLRTPFEGTGKPEPLKGKYSGCWSRSISGRCQGTSARCRGTSA